MSRHHGVQVCRALGAGVLDALEVLLGALTRGARPPSAALWEQSLTVLYRVLFLLFAEARGLVPLWHPVYRDRYSLEVIVNILLEGRQYKGLWRAIHAISRLAHAGCTAGELRVTAFNGRLFAPAHAAAFDSTRLSDPVMSTAIMSLSSTPASRSSGRTKILYRDLDVEQLGAVYERVLDYELTPAVLEPRRQPAPSGWHSRLIAPGPHRSRKQRTHTEERSGDRAHAPRGIGQGPGLVRTRDLRKSSGSFYTPRAVTTFLVRRTLEPFVSWPTVRRDPESPDSRPGDGERCVPRCGMPLPGSGC